MRAVLDTSCRLSVSLLCASFPYPPILSTDCNEVLAIWLPNYLIHCLDINVKTYTFFSFPFPVSLSFPPALLSSLLCEFNHVNQNSAALSFSMPCSMFWVDSERLRRERKRVREWHGESRWATGHLEQRKQFQVTAQQFGENHHLLLKHDSEAFTQSNTQVQSLQTDESKCLVTVRTETQAKSFSSLPERNSL